MILHRFHAGDILGGNLKRVALAFIHNHAPQIDVYLPHDNIRCRNWRPQFAFHLGYQTLTNLRVVEVGMRCASRQTDHAVHDVGTRDDTDNLMAAYYWHALDAMPLHQLHDIFERGVFANRLHFDRHHLRDLGAVRMRVFLGDSARAHQEFKPPRTLPFGMGLLAAEEIAFRQNTDKLTLLIDYWQAANVVLRSEERRVGE